jgi:hypothetical protein
VNAIVRRRLEMAARVRDFLRTHKLDGVGEGLGLAKLEELLTRAEVLANQQRSGLVATRAATLQRAGSASCSGPSCSSISGRWAWWRRGGMWSLRPISGCPPGPTIRRS